VSRPASNACTQRAAGARVLSETGPGSVSAASSTDGSGVREGMSRVNPRLTASLKVMQSFLPTKALSRMRSVAK